MADTWQAQVRLERPAAGPLLHTRIGGQVEHLKQEPTWRTGNRNATTLTKGPTLRVVLIVLKKGATLHEHQVSGPITIQAIPGSCRLTSAGQVPDLRVWRGLQCSNRRSVTRSTEPVNENETGGS